MEDIRLAIGLMAFVSIAVFAVSYRLLRDRPAIWLDITAVVTVALLIAYVYFVWGQLWIVRYIPLPSVLILSNWFPPMLAVLAAIAWLRFEPKLPEPKSSTAADATLPQKAASGAFAATFARRMPVQVVLLGGAIYSVFYFVPSEAPECGAKWQFPPTPFVHPVCLQTTPHTCSAAAAATVLNALGDETSEQEMAELCLTKSGTTWLGLYHGLSWKLMGTPFGVEFFESDPASVADLAVPYPVLLCCRLDFEVARRRPKYVQAGWIPGTAHSVAYFGTFRDLHIIGDPAVGYELWQADDLAALWTGEGLRIASRSSVANAAVQALSRFEEPQYEAMLRIRNGIQRRIAIEYVATDDRWRSNGRNPN